MEGRPGIARRLERLLRGRFVGVAIGLVVFCALAGMRALGWLEPLELGAYDQFVRWRAQLGERPGDSDPPVVLVRIREQDISRFGHPIPDVDLARALAAILARGPRAVGVDLYRTSPVGTGQAELEAVVRADPRVAFIELIASGGDDAIEAPSFTRGTRQAAAADVVTDRDGISRRGLVLVWDRARKQHASLAWWLALTYLARGPDPITPQLVQPAGGTRTPIRLGRGEIWRFEADDGGYRGADAADYQILLDFEYGRRPFPSLSFSDAFDGRIDPALVRDKVVIVGTMAPSVKDDFYTPLGPPGPNAPVTKGVELHAHAVDQLLRVALAGTTPVRTLNGMAEALWLLVWCLVWGLVGNQVRSLPRVLLAVVVGVLLLAGSFPLFLLGWWTPVVPPALAWIGAGGLAAALALVRERRDRALLDRMLAVHVSSAVRDRLWAERDRFLDEGRLRAQRTCITVLMTDLEGFTSASERLGDPGLVMRWLNEYMDRMVPIVEDHGGVVDGYWGDAIKADFGAPLVRETEEEIDLDARNAVRCALAMGDAMRELVVSWRERGLPPVRMRIGIFTGPVVAGSQGSVTRQKYTSLGDTVNTAARLESFDKEGFGAEPAPTACRILIGEATRLRLGSAFRLQALGSHGLKGKGDTIEIHRVLGLADPPGREGR